MFINSILVSRETILKFNVFRFTTNKTPQTTKKRFIVKGKIKIRFRKSHFLVLNAEEKGKDHKHFSLLHDSFTISSRNPSQNTNNI